MQKGVWQWTKQLPFHIYFSDFSTFLTHRTLSHKLFLNSWNTICDPPMTFWKTWKNPRRPHGMTIYESWVNHG